MCPLPSSPRAHACLPVRADVELLLLFDQVDLSDDRRLDFDEFCKALPLLDGWGMAVADPRAEFTSIDTNGGGFLMFDE
jgi:hypothetical protein